MAKKVAKKAEKKSAKMEMLLVGSKTKEVLKGKGKFNVSSDALDALNKYVYWVAQEAQARCAANGRKTIKAHDILASC